jgi:hypothetical protein
MATSRDQQAADQFLQRLVKHGSSGGGVGVDAVIGRRHKRAVSAEETVRRKLPPGYQPLPARGPVAGTGP